MYLVHVYNHHASDPLHPSDVLPDELQTLRSLSHYDTFPAEGKVHRILDNRTLRLPGRLQIQEKRLPYSEHQRADNKQRPVHRRVGPPGGNQQKAIFGKWLERSPNIFMMDDPTRGIDVGAKYEIYELIINMAKQGKTIIVVSSEMPEILGITNRIGVMSNGHLAGIVNTKETNQEELLRLSAKYL